MFGRSRSEQRVRSPWQPERDIDAEAFAFFDAVRRGEVTLPDPRTLTDPDERLFVELLLAERDGEPETDSRAAPIPAALIPSCQPGPGGPLQADRPDTDQGAAGPDLDVGDADEDDDFEDEDDDEPMTAEEIAGVLAARPAAFAPLDPEPHMLEGRDPRYVWPDKGDGWPW